jgi:hypothetical protein
MAEKASSSRIGGPAEVAVNRADWSEAELRFRTSVIEHCKWIATFDRDYAEWTFRNYRRDLPWLKL